MGAREMTTEELRLQREETVRLAGMYGVAPAMLEQVQAFGAQLARIEAKLDRVIEGPTVGELAAAIAELQRQRPAPQNQINPLQRLQDQIDPYVR
jgi:hypothetical protein